MSIVEEGRKPLDPKLIRWGGYGLAGAGLAGAVVANFSSGPSLAALALVLTLAPVAVGLYAPQLFEVKGRLGRRGFNPLLGGPALMLFVFGVQLHLLDFQPAWFAAGVLAAVAALASWASSRRQTLAGPIQFVIAMAVIGALYGYGASTLVDVRFDRAAGQPVQVTVAGRHISYGRTTTYYLDLPPWGPQRAAGSVEVSSSLYNEVQPGDAVCLTLYPGALRMRWFTVDLCRAAVPA